MERDHHARRVMLHAAVASGGASAALMSFGVNCIDEAELRAGASECLEPLLRAVLHSIDAAGVLPGEAERAALRDLIADYLETPRAEAPEHEERNAP
jgi:hypothetical protein